MASEPQVLIFGGPYSNSAALIALRRRARELAVPADRCFCTGDVVAYGGEPEETVDILRDWGCHVIAGNCEEQLAMQASDCGCGFQAGSTCDRLSKGWYAFANQRISRASRSWMAGLPKVLSFSEGGLSFRVVHGTEALISRFVFASDHNVIAQELDRTGADVIVAGHCGLPFIKKLGRCAWFNPGVIGMPANDGTPDGWYGVIAAGRGGVTLATQRLAYDFHAAADAMLREGYADAYAQAITTGLWPSLDVLPDLERAATGQKLAESSVVLTPALA